jgi:hypothetical protein
MIWKSVFLYRGDKLNKLKSIIKRLSGIKSRDNCMTEETPFIVGQLKNQEDLADMMMDNIVRFGMFSFELEEKREQSLINQSNRMFTAFSIFTVALFMILPIVIGLYNTLTSKIMFCVGIVSFLLLASLVLALLAQWRFKYVTMSDIEEFYRKVNEEFSIYKTQASFDMQWKEQILSIHTSKKRNNDTRSKLIQASMWVFLIAIGVVLLSSFALIFNIL